MENKIPVLVREFKRRSLGHNIFIYTSVRKREIHSAYKKQLFFNDLFNESLTTKLNIPSVSGPVQESSFFPKTLATVNSKGRLYHQL